MPKTTSISRSTRSKSPVTRFRDTTSSDLGNLATHRIPPASTPEDIAIFRIGVGMVVVTIFMLGGLTIDHIYGDKHLSLNNCRKPVSGVPFPWMSCPRV